MKKVHNVQIRTLSTGIFILTESIYEKSISATAIPVECLSVTVKMIAGSDHR